MKDFKELFKVTDDQKNRIQKKDHFDLSSSIGRSEQTKSLVLFLIFGGISLAFITRPVLLVMFLIPAFFSALNLFLVDWANLNGDQLTLKKFFGKKKVIHVSKIQDIRLRRNNKRTWVILNYLENDSRKRAKIKTRGMVGKFTQHDTNTAGIIKYAKEYYS